MNRILDVYLHEKYVGKYSQDKQGQYAFEYDTTYAKDPNSPKLSISLPLSTVKYADNIVRPFFAGLLPEATLRSRIARCLGISEKNDFSFLQAIGGECAGAVALCTEVYPNISMKMAMKLGGKYDPYYVYLRHWHRIVADSALARNELEGLLLSMTKKCLDTAYFLQDKLATEGITAPIFSEIINVIAKRTKHVQQLLDLNS